MRRLSMIVCLLPQWVFAGAFIFSDTNLERFTHPTPYTGTGGEIEVTFCVNPASESLDDLEVSARNVATVFNNLEPVTGNVLLGGGNNIPGGAVDFESTLLHEVGHCLGLAHPNLASESGISSASWNYTQASRGANNTFNIEPGNDLVIGSADDLRGDDGNRHWFRIADNNPFLVEAIVDTTTYSVDLAQICQQVICLQPMLIGRSAHYLVCQPRRPLCSKGHLMMRISVSWVTMMLQQFDWEWLASMKFRVRMMITRYA